jgi:excisionase family DNA binding protein
MKRTSLADQYPQAESHVPEETPSGQDSPHAGSTTREIMVTAFREIDRRLAAIETRMPPPKLLTVGEAAERLSVSVQTIRRWCRTGRIPYVRRGHELRIDLSKVRALTTEEVASVARGR